MIIDSLYKVDLYESAHPRMEKAFQFLRNLKADAAPGRYEISGKTIFANIQDYMTKPLSEGFWEAHRSYIDVQVLLSGIERIGYANIDSLIPGAYDREKDLVKLEGTGDFLTIRPGLFMVLFPQDAHMPGVFTDKPIKVRKVVVKIAV